MHPRLAMPCEQPEPVSKPVAIPESQSFVVYDTFVVERRCSPSTAEAFLSKFLPVFLLLPTHLHHHPSPPRQHKSPGQPPHLLHTPIQPRNSPQTRTLPILLRNRHVSALQALTQHIHDPRRDVANLLVGEVDIAEHRVQPVEAGFDVGGEGGGDGRADAQGDERRDVLKVAWVDADEDGIEEMCLVGGLKPL